MSDRSDPTDLRGLLGGQAHDHDHDHEHHAPTIQIAREGDPMRHFLEVDDLSLQDLMHVLDLSELALPPQVLKGRGAALVFEKPSLRTRSSIEMAVVQLGGHPVAIGAAEVGLGTRETPEDVARTLGSYHAVIAARVFEHEKLEAMAAVDAVPVVNLLSDTSHPLQAVADLLTLGQHFHRLRDLTVAYVGDANNVSRSLGIALAMVGSRLHMACPSDYSCSEVDLDRIRSHGGDVEIFDRPEDAVVGADAVYTDVWASMGKEEEVEARRRAFEGFTVDRSLMAQASDHAIFLHCLPAHRGEEVTHDVIEAPGSFVWKQAANRMHTARGLLAYLIGAANWSPLA